MTDSPASDIDALDSLESSEGWALVKARIEREIERRRDDLERGGKDDERNRGYIEALRMHLRIPANLRVELKAGLKEQE